MERPLSPSLVLQCTRCKKGKHLSEFDKPNGGFFSHCSPCRVKMQGYQKTYNKKEKSKERYRKYQKTDKRKVTKARHKQTERFAQTEAAYAPRKKELRNLEYERIHSDPGLHLQHAIVCKIGKMISLKATKSTTVMQLTDFNDADDLRIHLERQFESWMSFDNFGKYKKGGDRVWNVGHRIARFHYNANDEEDVRRCWMKQNLFPQDALENIQRKVKFPDEVTLLELKSSWPSAWNDQLPSQSELVRMERKVFAMCGSWER